MIVYKKNIGVTLTKYEERFVVIYNYEVYNVNEVGARIIELCNYKNDFNSILNKLASHFKVDEKEISLDISEYIEQLIDLNIIKQIDIKG